MASNNQIELVVTVEVDKANRSIKSVNANLSGIEAAATKSARAASQGIDGMTAAMVKGATAGNLFADAIKKALSWAKSWTLGAVEYAAHSSKVLASAKALGQAHGYSSQQVEHWVEQVKKIGYHTQEATHTINRLMIANMDLAKATGLAKLAKDAAAIENIGADEAMEKLLLAIEGGVSRGLRSMGIFLNFEQEVQREELKLGKTLSENEIQQIRYNAVMREGAKIAGAHAGAQGEAEAQVKKFKREMVELREVIGQRFQDNYKAMAGHLKDAAKWLKENVDLLEKFGKVALWVSGVLATYALATKIMDLAKSIAALRLASLNPYALLAGGVLAAGAIVYSNWKDMQEQMEARFKDQEREALRQQALAGKAKQGKDGTWSLGDRTFTTEEMQELVSGRRAIGAGDIDVSGLPKLAIKTGNEPTMEQLKLAADIRKRQQEVVRESVAAAEQAGVKGKTGFAKDFAEVNEQIRKWTTFTDDKGVERRIALTRDAWVNVIDQLERRWGAFKRALFQDNKKALADHLKDEEEAARKVMEWEAQRFQQRLQHDVEIAERNMDHLRDVYASEEQRAGFEKDARLQQLEGADAVTLQQKIAVERQKAAIEIEYLERVHEVRQRLYDLDTSRMLMEEELNLKRLGYKADEIKARIAELSQQREVIREHSDEANDATLQAARENASNRTAQLIRDHNRGIFESLKQQAGGVFDALLSKSKSVWSAIGDSFKTAILTAIKEVVSSRVAAMLMQLFTGTKVSLTQGGGAGGGGGVLGRLGGILGIGAVPVFAGGGGGIFGGGWGGTQSPYIFSAAGGGQGGGALFPAGSIPGIAQGGGSVSRLAQLQSAAALGGGIMALSGLQRGGAAGSAMTLGGSALAGYGLASQMGMTGYGGAITGAGAGLFALGLKRGGLSGLGMDVAGGAIVGMQFGGPIGAAIGAGVGFAAGLVRLFVKGAEEKARQKVKAAHGVDISDKNLLKQIVDTAKQAYGGNLDMAIRSKPVLELIQLYAMSTGQNSPLQAAPRPVNLVQQGGGIFQAGSYENGSLVGYSSAFPSVGGVSLDRLAPTGYGTGNPVFVNISLDGQATTKVLQGEAVQAVQNNPRVVQRAASSAQQGSYGRRQAAATLLQPGTVLA